MVIFKLADHGQWLPFITEGEHGHAALNVITVAHYAGNSCIVIKLARNAFFFFLLFFVLADAGGRPRRSTRPGNVPAVRV